MSVHFWGEDPIGKWRLEIISKTGTLGKNLCFFLIRLTIFFLIFSDFKKFSFEYSRHKRRTS
jgi:hypothetical protein